MELRHLRYFLAVAERRNFSRAAEQLATAQPSLSRQIRQLEREIGVELFVRGPRDVALTPAGIEFLADARAILARVETAAARAREAGRGIRGELRIAYTVSTMMSIVPAAIRAYREEYPNVRVSLRAMTPVAMLAALRAREADVGVSMRQHERVTVDGIDARRIGALGFAAVVPEGHRLAGRRRIAIEEIGEATLLLYARALTDVYDAVVALCRERGFTPLRIEEVDRVETILGLVAAGEGVSVVPDVYRTLGFHGVAFVGLAPAPHPFAMIAARSSDARSAAAEAFLAICARIGEVSY